MTLWSRGLVPRRLWGQVVPSSMVGPGYQIPCCPAMEVELVGRSREACWAQAQGSWFLSRLGGSSRGLGLVQRDSRGGLITIPWCSKERAQPLRNSSVLSASAHTHWAMPLRMDGQSYPQQSKHTPHTNGVPTHHSLGSCRAFQQMFPANSAMWIVPKEQQAEHSPPKSCQHTEAGKRRSGAPNRPLLFTTACPPPSGWARQAEEASGSIKSPCACQARPSGLQWEAREMGGWSEGCSHTQGGGEGGGAADEIPGKASDWDGGGLTRMSSPPPDGCSRVRMWWAVCSSGRSPPSYGPQSFPLNLDS